LPQPVISGSLDFCQGFNTTLNATAGYTNYLWNNGSTSSSITLNTATTVTVTVTDGNGCVNNTSATTIVNPNPVPNITGTPTTCQGLTTPIDAGGGYSGYLWSTGATSQILNIESLAGNCYGYWTATVVLERITSILLFMLCQQQQSVVLILFVTDKLLRFR
jgi:hypothetical protein